MPGACIAQFGRGPNRDWQKITCDTGPTTGSGPWAPAGRSNETLTSFGGNVYSAIRLGHPRASTTNSKPAPCNSYNASADPLGPCFTSPAEAKAYLGTIPAGHRAISLEGQPTLYTIQIGNLTVPRHLECFDPIADSVNGPWLDAWSETVHARFQKWFEEFHSLGGQVGSLSQPFHSSLPLPLDSQSAFAAMGRQVDIVMLDWENGAAFYDWVA